MRFRNVKNKEEILASCPFLIQNPKQYRGNCKKLFNNDNPIYLEIGMGKGYFLFENAKRYPDRNFIGIEKYDAVLAKAVKDKEILPNLFVIRLDAKEVATIFDHEIDRIYLNFSDPWPKKKHHDRRLTSPVFLECYENIFKQDKNIELRTDDADLFLYSIETLSGFGYHLQDLSLDYHQDHNDIIMTEYETKFSARGNNIYYIFARK